MQKYSWLKYAVIAAFSIVVLIAYLIAGAMVGDGSDVTNRVLTVVATAFGLATYMWFLFEVIIASDSDMGKFIADRNSIIIGLLLMSTFLVITLTQSFANLRSHSRTVTSSSSQSSSGSAN